MISVPYKANLHVPYFSEISFVHAYQLKDGKPIQYIYMINETTRDPTLF